MTIDVQKTAVLALDFQQGILQRVPSSEAVVAQAAKAAEFARQKQIKLIHVGIGFEEGHPEIPDTQMRFKAIKDANLFVKGSATAEFHSQVKRSGELVIYKQRISAFSENTLEMVLRSNGIDTLVLMGVATSGIVLSTLRRAFDLDFRCFVLKDACADGDEEVHRVLTEKVFASQATVMTVDAFITEHA